MAERAATRSQRNRVERYEQVASDALEQAVVLRELLATFVRSTDEETDEEEVA
jgi:hypothetical protein